jgi:hypothetical protein
MAVVAQADALPQARAAFAEAARVGRAEDSST